MAYVRREATRRPFDDRARPPFLGGGVALHGLPAEILRAWRRVRDAFDDPGQRRCPRLLTPSELAERCDRDEPFRIARPILDESGASLADCQDVLAYFDASGWMLSLSGNRSTAAQLAEIGFCPGANWGEDPTATNGPPTALAGPRPVEVFASEHLVSAWQAWSCVAAPIHAPGSGELLGVAGLAGPWQAHEAHALVTVRAIARAVEERLRSARVSAPERTRGSARASAARGNTARYDFAQILGESDAIHEALSLARTASRNELPVVLLGESGTGKELFAQAIHSASGRAGGPFVAVNCGCIPATLLEAELFGYEAGTFTGGRKEGNAGKFEEADGGTIFLDEASELSPQAQTALLRVLQEREVVRLGASTPRRVDIRVIAATNKGLLEEVRSGRFRSDLYFRLNVLAISVPSLKKRRADIGLLARAFLREAETETGRSGLTLSDDALRALEEYEWPGNVRELRNVLLRGAATAPGPLIDRIDLPDEIRAADTSPAARAGAPPPSPAGADSADREALLRALEASAWNVARTAHALDVSRMTLYRWLRKHGIER